MSRLTPPTYKTRNWPAHNGALKRRGSLIDLVRPRDDLGCRADRQAWVPANLSRYRRPDVSDDKGAVRHGAAADDRVRRKLVALDWSWMDGARLQHAVPLPEDPVNIPYHGSKGELHLLIDSTGIKVEGEGEWHARKHGGPKRRVWRKIHPGIDEETLEIQAVEITGSHIGDAPILPDLLSQILEGQEIGSVTAEGAYDTRKCHDAIADRGAHAVIPPRKNAKPWTENTAGAAARNEALRASKYLGRAIW